MNNATNVANTSALEILNTRVIDRPRELVWKAWTNPEHLARWWGPKGFTNTFQEFDMTTGGAWRFIMHGPDGANYQNDVMFIDIVKPERIASLPMRPLRTNSQARRNFGSER